MAMIVFVVIVVVSIYVIRLWIHDAKLRQEPIKLEQLQTKAAI